jgi:hypothetical protein
MRENIVNKINIDSVSDRTRVRLELCAACHAEELLGKDAVVG